MDVRRDFEARPPREPLTSLAAYVRDFQWRFPVDRRDMVVEFCRTAPDFRAAVRRACASRNALGKMHNHQSRVRESDRVIFGDEIISNARAVEDFARLEGFDSMHDYLDHIKPQGIGPVTVYDVAVRLGAYLGIEPQSLYLHAGVRQGWISMKLALEGVAWPTRGAGSTLAQIRAEARRPYIRREDWPKPLQVLTADEAEDFCCTYREEIRRYRNTHGRLEEGQ